MTVRVASSRSWRPICLSLWAISVGLAPQAGAQTSNVDTEGAQGRLTLPDTQERPEPKQDPAFLELRPLSEDSADLLDAEGRHSSRTVDDDQPRGQTVMNRKRRGFEAEGVGVGSFILNPEVSVAGSFDSNVFSQSDSRSDIYAQLSAGAKLQSNWSRHSLLLEGDVNQFTYAKYSSEDGSSYRLRAQGSLDVTDRQSLSADVRHQYVRASRGAVGEVLATREPVRYYLTAGDVSGRSQWGRYSAELTGAVSRYDYKNATNLAGAPVDEQFRDFTRYQLRLDLAYAMGAARSIFVTVSGDRRRYRLNAAAKIRNVNGYEVLAGLRSEITPLLQGQLGIGYIHADFRDPATKSRGALTVDTRLDYLMTELTTISLAARRSIENASSATSSATLDTRLRLGVDHELLRNLILSASADYEHSDNIGAPGKADVKSVEFGATWFVNRWMRADGNIRAAERNGKDIAFQRDYRDVSVTLGLTFRL